jgi:hypothetical protein
MISEWNFILGPQSTKLTEDRFDWQYKYVNDLIKNFGMKTAISIKAHMVTNGHLHLDEKDFGSRLFYYGYY